MIRMAQVADIPAMLDIYGPYVLSTTYTFEYTVPTLEAFSARFSEITRQFPWLVWEENGKVLMPLSITCHHATTDGYHISEFLKDLQNDMDNFETFITNN